ncbi:hypothetical protein R6Q57_013974 [Mikania cordata]
MDPNNPYFNPFRNCYGPQLDPNNANNPNQFPTFSNWHIRKEVPEKTTKSSITRWSEVEEVALARACIDVSEDPIVGNNQTSTEFSRRVRAQFFPAMGRDSYRLRTT